MNGVIRFWFAPVLLLVGGIVLAAVVDGDDAVDLPIDYYSKNEFGASGYDVVAYFDQSAATRGKEDIRAKYDGQVWLFDSAENRDKFLQTPRRYIPQYGGHCAYGFGKGYPAPGDPLAWTVKNNKLYLNFSKSVRNIWLAEIGESEEFIARGDANWLEHLRKQNN